MYYLLSTIDYWRRLFQKNRKWSLVNGQLPAESGFTLIELIVVIGIIAILSSMLIAIINPVSQFEKARDAQRKSDLTQIQKELEQYYQDTGHYPSSTNTFQIIGINGGTISFGTSNTSNWPYANQLPQDPNVNSRTYVYYSTGQSYWLYASLERGGNDPQACNSGSACTTMLAGGSGFPTAHDCSPTKAIDITCNYGVSSPNTTP